MVCYGLQSFDGLQSREIDLAIFANIQEHVTLIPQETLARPRRYR